jgi:peptidoglycan lytic transglycosylase G
MARHFAANFVNILIILLIVLGGLVYWGKTQFSAPGPLTESKIVTVERGDRLAVVADRLMSEGVISNLQVFRLGARYSGNETSLKFGEYEIPARASMQQVLALITSGRSISYQVTIPEGFTVYQVITRLNENPLLTGEVPEMPSEGSLAPETYAISKGDSRVSVVRRMVEAQSKILQDAWANRADDLPFDSMQQALILASIIEKETGVNSEREEVAGVFVNRLNKGMKLQTDPTVIYGITQGKDSLGRGLRRSELLKKTPYNTYIIPGLPPTPISNPGKAAIFAAMHPNKTNNLFFVADGTGGHVFAETLVQHNRNVAKWRKIEAKRRRDAAAAASE